MRRTLLVCPFLFLTACASTMLRSVDRAPDFHAANIHHVLIISLNNVPETRLRVEDEFVRQWRSRGVDAKPSHDVLPPGTPLEKTHVAPIAKAQGFDSVLVSRLLGRSKIDPHIQGQDFDVEATTSSENLSQYYDAVVASPAYSENYQIAVVTASLYDVATEKRMWMATTQTLVAEDLPKVIKDYAEVILENLYKR